MVNKLARSKTGVTGVIQAENGKYRAYITVNKKRIWLGRFETFDEAVEARKSAEEKYYTADYKVDDKRQKDYSEFIGQKFNQLKIVEIETVGLRHYFKCLCDCGKYKRYKPSFVLSGRIKSCGHTEGWALFEKNEELKELQRQSMKPLVTNKTTGYKNISYNKEKKTFDVEVTRNGTRYRKRLYSLKDAIEYRNELLEELRKKYEKEN